MQAPPRLSSKDKVYTEEGIVTIQALEQKWLQPTTDVLTEAFADAKGYTQYSEFLRRKIRLYLQEHMELLPQAVVLVAFLTPHTPARATPRTAGAAGNLRAKLRPRSVPESLPHRLPCIPAHAHR
ncbi:MAG: hypothetical protein WDW38_006191 [Sanguina aurantia]